MTLSVGSLCSGYGGLDLAVCAHYGGTVAWHSEVDPDACKVLDARYPGVPNLGDLTVVDWADVLRVDVLTAGYPCQPFSQAGQRRGTNDERHLWPWIANAISVLRPRVVVLENVRGHLSLGATAVLGDLAGMGYDAVWGVVRASDTGAPHRRERLFIVAHDPEVTTPRPVGAGGLVRPNRALNLLFTPTVPDKRPARSVELARARLAARAGGLILREMIRDWPLYADAVAHWAAVTGREVPPPLDHLGRLSPLLVEWMMGLEAGWVTDVVRTRNAIGVLANGVVPQQAALALRLLDREGACRAAA